MAIYKAVINGLLARCLAFMGITEYDIWLSYPFKKSCLYYADVISLIRTIRLWIILNFDTFRWLPHQAKTQYLQILNIIKVVCTHG